jgi:hypothetical protein
MAWAAGALAGPSSAYHRASGLGTRRGHRVTLADSDRLSNEAMPASGSECPTESHCQADRPPPQPAGRSALVGRPPRLRQCPEEAGRAVVTPVTEFKHVRAAQDTSQNRQCFSS